MSDLAEQIREALAMFARTGTEPALIGGLAVVAHQVVRATKGVDFSGDTDTDAGAGLGLADAAAVLAREAGVPFQAPMHKDSGVDPMSEWLSLMEVVQMLCPVWPVRDKPMQGDHWRL
ncbi:MAG: hypothetical protein KBF63_21415 [Rhodoferax sp.]|nr:hypothetical protein [Rhodoferax sp.]HQZ07290.1 hypothetical protein [Burkholderiaceae bacterium]HRA64351.1 hypothetical protein [Burkholderiaceae bacterium]